MWGEVLGLSGTLPSSLSEVVSAIFRQDGVLHVAWSASTSFAWSGVRT